MKWCVTAKQFEMVQYIDIVTPKKKVIFRDNQSTLKNENGKPHTAVQSISPQTKYKISAIIQIPHYCWDYRDDRRYLFFTLAILHNYVSFIIRSIP